MNFDDILPFLIFLAYIGFTLFKKILGKKKEPKKDKPAWKISLGFSKIMTNIKSELAKAVDEAKLKEKQAAVTPRKNIWEKLRGDSQEDKIADREFEEKDQALAQNIIQQVPDSYDHSSDIAEQSIEPVDKPLVDEPQTHAYSISKPKKGLRLSVTKMREVIILSEILAKPIGLRE
jgi:hypothetical protein